ncbi:MAG: DMT family transporter [Chloroflexota bacterium]
MIDRRGGRALPVLALLGITAIWGWTFVIVRDAVSGYPVAPFLALRFVLAALILAPAVFLKGSGIRAGLLPGVVLACAYLTQTIGLRYTTASKAGLLTGLFVVLTPVLGYLVLRRPPRGATVVSVIGALVGTALLVGPLQGGGSREALGDGLEVATALLLSCHILLLAHLAAKANVLRLAFSQMMAGAILFSGGALFTGEIPPPPSVWPAILITGVLASALAFLVQTFVQQRISAERTAVIMASEPAFATLFGIMLAGDHFSLSQAAGAAAILLAIGYHEIPPALNRRRLAGS